VTQFEITGTLMYDCFQRKRKCYTPKVHKVSKRNSNSSESIQIKTKSRFEFVSRDTESHINLIIHNKNTELLHWLTSHVPRNAIWIRIAREKYQEFWDSRLCGFLGCSNVNGNCHKVTHILIIRLCMTVSLMNDSFPYERQFPLKSLYELSMCVSLCFLIKWHIWQFPLWMTVSLMNDSFPYEWQFPLKLLYELS